MALVKYLGSADVRRLEKGEKFGGRLADPLSKDVEWSRENGFVVNTDDLDLSEDAVSLLLSEPDFKDVSDLKRIPLSMNEKIFGGLSDVEEEAVAEVVQTEAVSGDKDGSEPIGGGTTARAARTTTGGSTAGRGGAAGGGAGTTVGGSTTGP